MGHGDIDCEDVKWTDCLRILSSCGGCGFCACVYVCLRAHAGVPVCEHSDKPSCSTKASNFFFVNILFVFMIFHYFLILSALHSLLNHYMVVTCRAQQFDSVHCPRLGVMPITAESSESDTSIQINALALKYLKHDDPGK
jgi:hypothetical protein